eukprot:XP_016658176.1 PREDICTED: uncharacterized protein LOC107883158 isoform X2 [Acyrthosiphon pisum]
MICKGLVHGLELRKVKFEFSAVVEEGGIGLEYVTDKATTILQDLRVCEMSSACVLEVNCKNIRDVCLHI